MSRTPDTAETRQQADRNQHRWGCDAFVAVHRVVVRGMRLGGGSREGELRGKRGGHFFERRGGGVMRCFLLWKRGEKSIRSSKHKSATKIPDSVTCFPPKSNRSLEKASRFQSSFLPWTTSPSLLIVRGRPNSKRNEVLLYSSLSSVFGWHGGGDSIGNILLV